MKAKAQMSLEYIVKLIIVLVVLAVVMGMIYKFKGDITKQWETIMNPGGENTESPDAMFIEGEFNAAEFANFIETCWVETRDAEGSKVCFVLKGSYTDNPGTAVNDIKGLLDPEITDNLDFSGVNFGDDLFSINYEIIGDEIHIKS